MIAKTLPNGRNIQQDKDGTFAVQPPNDNWWKSGFKTVEAAEEWFLAYERKIEEVHKPAKSRKASVYLADRIRRVIGDVGQGELSGRIADIVDRYGVICDMGALELERAFTADELRALCAATWSTLWQPASTIIRGILADWEDSKPDGLYAEWHVDGKAVSAKLRALSVGQQIALVEYLERLKRRLCAESETARP